MMAVRRESSGRDPAGFIRDAGISAAPEVLRMYQAAIDGGLVSAVDALTVRDVLTAAGCPGAPAFHALMIAMFACANRGSMCLPLDPDVLTREFAPFCREHTPAVVAAALEMAMESPLLLSGDGGPWPLFVSGGRLYFQSAFVHEESLRAGLTRLVGNAGAGALSGPAAAAALVGGVSARAAGGAGLNERQKLALFLALTRRFLVVSGGPGTGKTALLASLVRAFFMAGGLASDILLIAPTGRAARRMGESVIGAKFGGDAPDDRYADEMAAVSGRTIHSALRWNPSRLTWKYTAFNRLPQRLVVCDEVSMVDVSLMDALVRAIRDDATVVFLGDRDQLPSVEAGAVLGDLVPSMKEPEYSPATLAAAAAAGIDVSGLAAGTGQMADSVVMLEKSYRSTGDVLARSIQVNRGNEMAFSDAAPGGQAFGRGVPDWGAPGALARVINPPSGVAGWLPDVLGSWADWLYGGDREMPWGSGGFRAALAAFRTVDAGADRAGGGMTWVSAAVAMLARGRVLCALREGVVGVAGVNETLRRIGGARETFYPGCPVIVTRNSPETGLFNGDTGVVFRTGARLHAWFCSGGRFIDVPVDGGVAIEPAHAITIHKAQGSEYDNVLVLLPEDADHPLMTREILYTAMTRVRNNVWLAGRQECLASAIRRRTSRYSGLDLVQGGSQGRALGQL